MGKYYSTSEFQGAMSGENGFSILVPATAATAADLFYCAITALEDSVITADATPVNASGNTSLGAGVTLLAGTTIYGQFDNIDVTSGKVLCYLAKPS